MSDTILLPQAQALLDCLQIELELNPDPPARFCLLAGPETIHDIDAQASLDKTCCPGLAYARIGQVYPSTTFPDPDPRSDRCLFLQRAMSITIGVIRCVPGIATPEGPSCEDWGLAATHDANDTDALFKAVCCWTGTSEFKSLRGRAFSIVNSDVTQPGDCIERFLTLLIQIPKCC